MMDEAHGVRSQVVLRLPGDLVDLSYRAIAVMFVPRGAYSMMMLL